jgi:hypothetical protein
MAWPVCSGPGGGTRRPLGTRSGRRRSIRICRGCTASWAIAGIGREAGRHPAVSLAKDADEERAALVDLLEAQVQHAVVLRLLARHAPAQVDVDQVDAVRLQSFAQGGENHFNQAVPFGVHVAERGTDEHADGPPAGHGEVLGCG